jgi:hypothetical protein
MFVKTASLVWITWIVLVLRSLSLVAVWPDEADASDIAPTVPIRATTAIRTALEERGMRLLPSESMQVGAVQRSKMTTPSGQQAATPYAVVAWAGSG